METQTAPSNEKIQEALRLLSEAARDKKQELRKIIVTRYSDLKDVLSEKTQTATHALDDSVHSRPWYYITGMGAGAIFIGYLLGRRHSWESRAA